MTCATPNKVRCTLSGDQFQLMTHVSGCRASCSQAIDYHLSSCASNRRSLLLHSHMFTCSSASAEGGAVAAQRRQHRDCRPAERCLTCATRGRLDRIQNVDVWPLQVNIFSFRTWGVCIAPSLLRGSTKTATSLMHRKPTTSTL